MIAGTAFPYAPSARNLPRFGLLVVDNSVPVILLSRLYRSIVLIPARQSTIIATSRPNSVRGYFILLSGRGNEELPTCLEGYGFSVLISRWYFHFHPWVDFDTDYTVIVIDLHSNMAALKYPDACQIGYISFALCVCSSDIHLFTCGIGQPSEHHLDLVPMNRSRCCRASCSS